MSAFDELNSDRPIGFSAGPIPYTAIDRFAVRHDIEGEDFQFLVRMIRAMDRVLLETSRKTGGQKSGPTTSARPMSPKLFDALF